MTGVYDPFASSCPICAEPQGAPCQWSDYYGPSDGLSSSLGACDWHLPRGRRTGHRRTFGAFSHGSWRARPVNSAGQLQLQLTGDGASLDQWRAFAARRAHIDQVAAVFPRGVLLVNGRRQRGRFNIHAPLGGLETSATLTFYVEPPPHMEASTPLWAAPRLDRLAQLLDHQLELTPGWIWPC